VNKKAAAGMPTLNQIKDCIIRVDVSKSQIPKRRRKMPIAELKKAVKSFQITLVKDRVDIPVV